MGKYLDMIRSAERTPEQTGPDKNASQGQHPVRAGLTLVPGTRMTWQGGHGTSRGPATVEFLHTDPDGTIWAFVTLPAGWVAVNTKVVTHIEEGDRHVEETK